MSRQDDWATYLDPDLEGGELSPEEHDSLDRIRATLADDATWAEPPPGLRDRILAQAAGEQPYMAGGADAIPLVRPKAPQARWWIPATAIAALAVVVVLVAVQANRTPSTDTFALAGTDLTPGVTATADVEPLPAGVAITLTVDGLPPAGDGEYYAAWLNGPDGSVAIGSFHMRDGVMPIELWSGVDTLAYPNLGVTIQQEGEPTVSSGVVVLQGRIAPEE